MVAIGRRLPQFALVGALGFCVDAGLMMLAVETLSWHPIEGRCVSFPVALSCTWLINRRWVFGVGSHASMGSEYWRYAAVQVLGAAVNMAVFLSLVACTVFFQALPLVALAVGAGCSLLLNYALLSIWVYPRQERVVERLPPMQTDQYTGVGNLEVMDQAVRYKAFLVGLIRREAPSGPGCVVDFGAGMGAFVQAVKFSGLDVVAVELDPALRQRIIQAGIRAEASLDDLAAGSVAYVYTLNVLEHIDDDMAALRDIHRTLACDGRLLIYVPAFMILFGPMDRLVGHRRRYRLGELTQRVLQAGFKVERAEYVDSIGFFLALLHRFIGSRSGSLNPRAVHLYDRILFPLSRRLDSLTRKAFGKNLLVVARRLESTAH